VEDIQRVFSDLIRFEAKLWTALDGRLRTEHHLPLQKFEIMRVIATTRDCRVYDIVGELSLTTGGVSKLVDALESSGYTSRRPNPLDRRSSIIELTPAGRKVLARANKTFNAELEAWFSSALSGRALRQLGDALSGLRAAANEAAAARAA
jgi:MarR family transcriptional regulator, organic hydroperoxide resistance regulator